MKAPTRTLLLAWLSCFAALTIYAANSKKTTNSDKKPEQIVVTVHKADKGFFFEVESGEIKKVVANYLLAELKLKNGGDCQFMAVVDDRPPRSAITECSEMAINAVLKATFNYEIQGCCIELIEEVKRLLGA